jgi:cyclase
MILTTFSAGSPWLTPERGRPLVPAEPVLTALSASAAAYLQLPGGWFLNNAGWIAGSDRTLVIDTCATEARSQHLLDSARAAGTPGAPLSAVLTHAHGDHSNGAGLVTRTGGSVMASAPAAEEIASGPHTYPTMFTCSTWGDIAPPTITDTVTEPVRVDLGGRVAEIVPVPVRAHTDGDLVVWLPQDGVLFAGDLVFSGVTPLALHGSIEGWLDALDWLAGFGAAHVVPGHGPVTTPNSAAVTGLRDYLRWLLDAVSNVDRPNFDALEQQARTRWAHWLDAERHAVNLRIAHAEAHRDSFDIETILAALLRSAGGPIQLDL